MRSSQANNAVAANSTVECTVGRVDSGTAGLPVPVPTPPHPTPPHPTPPPPQPHPTPLDHVPPHPAPPHLVWQGGQQAHVLISSRVTQSSVSGVGSALSDSAQLELGLYESATPCTATPCTQLQRSGQQALDALTPIFQPRFVDASATDPLGGGVLGDGALGGSALGGALGGGVLGDGSLGGAFAKEQVPTRPPHQPTPPCSLLAALLAALRAALLTALRSALLTAPSPPHSCSLSHSLLTAYDSTIPQQDAELTRSAPLLPNASYDDEEAATEMSAPIPGGIVPPRPTRPCTRVVSRHLVEKLKLGEEKKRQPPERKDFFKLLRPRNVRPSWRCSCCTDFDTFEVKHSVDLLPQFERERTAFRYFAWSEEPVDGILHCDSRGDCAFDGKERHTHAGYLTPLYPARCYGTALRGGEQCRACMYAEHSTERTKFFRALKIDIPKGKDAPKSALQQQATHAEAGMAKEAACVQPKGPAPHKKKSTYTMLDWQRTAAVQEQKAREAAELIAQANKCANAAGRHQSTAEQVAAATKAESDREHTAAQVARTAEAAATVLMAAAQGREASALAAAQRAEEQCSAEAVAAAARLQEEREATAQQLAAKHTEAIAAEEQRSAEAVAAAARLQAEREAAAQQLAAKQAEAEAHTEEQRRHHREEQEAATERLAGERREAVLREVAATERYQAKEAQCQELLRENVDLKREVRQLKELLENSISRDDVPDFWLAVLNLYRKEGIRSPDVTLLKHLSARLVNPRAKVAGPMHDLQMLLVNKLCRQDYTNVADVIKLSCFEHAAAQRSEGALVFQMGENLHIVKEVASPRYSGHLVISMGDGSRASRLIERFWDVVAKRAFLVGESFDPDVRKWPGLEGGRGCQPMPQTLDEAFKYINLVRKNGLMSHEVHTEAFNCTSDRSLGMVISVLFPEPPSGFCAIHHLRYWYRQIQIWYDGDIRCTGLSTDSCSTGLGAGMALMTPSALDIADGVTFLGLPDRDFTLLARHMGGKVSVPSHSILFHPVPSHPMPSHPTPSRPHTRQVPCTIRHLPPATRHPATPRASCHERRATRHARFTMRNTPHATCHM